MPYWKLDNNRLIIEDLKGNKLPIYLLIGFGIFKAIMFSNAPHFMAKLGAWLVISLGILNIINHFFPKFQIKLRIPTASKEINQWNKRILCNRIRFYVIVLFSFLN